MTVLAFLLERLSVGKQGDTQGWAWSGEDGRLCPVTLLFYVGARYPTVDTVPLKDHCWEPAAIWPFTEPTNHQRHPGRLRSMLSGLCLSHTEFQTMLAGFSYLLRECYGPNLFFFLKKLNAHITRRRMLVPSQRTERSQMLRLDLTLTEPQQLDVGIVSKHRSTWSLKGLWVQRGKGS